MFTYLQSGYLFGLLTLSMMATAEFKDGEELYDLAPKGSAFFRIINQRDVPISGRINDRFVTANEYCMASNYVFIEPGFHQAEGAGWHWQGNLAADTAYSLVVGQHSYHLIDRPVRQDPMSADFNVYNLFATSPVSVTTAVRETKVFNEIPSFSRVDRKLNPLRIGFSVSTAEGRMTETEMVTFQRGRTTDLLVCGGEDQLETRIITR